MIKYAIKEKMVTEPEIELPEGSQVVSVVTQRSIKIEMSAPPTDRWEVVWLEPIIEQ